MKYTPGDIPSCVTSTQRMKEKQMKTACCAEKAKLLIKKQWPNCLSGTSNLKYSFVDQLVLFRLFSKARFLSVQFVRVIYEKNGEQRHAMNTCSAGIALLTL